MRQMTATATDFRSLTGTYTIDPAHSRFGFVARHAMVTKVRGAFNDFEGSAVIDGENPANSSASVTFQGAAKDPFGNDRIGLEGSVTINRKDWGVNWNAALETGGVLVSEKVTLEFEISAIKTA